MKEVFFKIEFKISGYYYGDGIIKVKDDKFEGYIAYDYVSGFYDANQLHVLLLQFDIETKELYESTFVGQIDAFELPNAFYVFGYGLEGCIDFIKSISISRQDFENRLYEVKKIY